MQTTIELTRGYTTVVDAEDADLTLFKWTAVVTQSGLVYARRWQRVNGKQKPIYMHRLILSRALATELNTPQQCDHIKGNGLDNRRTNLRLATNSQNQQNRALGRNNTSGVRGVRWVEARQKWDARITKDGCITFLGHFDDFDQAVTARRNAELELFGEYSLLVCRKEA